MRLLSCYIENFGKLKDLSVTFEDGCNVICRENGWGKSTLAAFIKVMLYGFEEEKARDDLKNERKRYRPWQGGVYGGRLEFEAAGERYVLTRTFGMKEKEDSFSLRKKDTNLECRDFSKAVGEDLFSLDCASFCRTVFLSQNDCETVSTDAINARIGNLTDATDDINNYENVNQRFAGLLNQMNPNRKTGSLYKCREEIARLEEEVRVGRSADQAMEKLYESLQQKRAEQDALKEEQALLAEKQQKIAAYKDIQVKREAYKSLCQEYQEREEQAKARRACFPAKVPERERLEEAIACSVRLSAAKEKVQIYEMSEEEIRRENDLEKLFREEWPDPETCDLQAQHLREMQELRVLMAGNSLSDEERERLDEGRNRFAQGVPELSEFESVISEWNECVERRNVLPQKKLTCETLQQISRTGAAGKGNRTGRGAWRTVLGILFLAAGLALLASGVWSAVSGKSPSLAPAAVAAGLIVLIAGAALLFWQRGRTGGREVSRSPEPADNDGLEQMKRQIAQDEAFIEQVESGTERFLERYGMGWERKSEILDRLYDLKAAVREYITLSEREKASAQGQQEERYRELAEEVKAFLNKYFPEEETDESAFGSELARIREAAGEYAVLKKKSNDLARAREAYRGLAGSLEAFLAELSIEPEPDLQAHLLRIRSHLQSYENSMQELLAAKERKEAFETAENMAEILQGEPAETMQPLQEITGRLEEIAGRLEQLYEYMADDNRHLDELRAESDQTAETAERLSALRESYEAGLEKYERIKITREYLERAKISLTARYTEPIRKGLVKYYASLTGEDAGRILVDANVGVTVDELGMQRDPRFFSAGYRDMIGICLRMALVDAMYREEKPFVVFDDPFANLDDSRLAGALNLLRQAGREYQILYFTCHDSRTPQPDFT